MHVFCVVCTFYMDHLFENYKTVIVIAATVHCPATEDLTDQRNGADMCACLCVYGLV